MRKVTSNKERAFTLVETLVVIGIFTMLSVGVTTLFSQIFKTSRQSLLSIDNIDQARLVSTNFINEIRVATIGVDGSHPVSLASDNEIIFYSDYRSTSGTQKVRYYLSGTTLYKGVTAPAGSPGSYNPASESTRAVQTDLATSSSPIFYYYDGNYDGASAALNQPINLNDIRYVRMNLNVYKRTESSATSTFMVSAGSTIRNLKDNLGN